MAEVWSQRLSFVFPSPQAPLPSRQRALVGPPRDAGGRNAIHGEDVSAVGGTLRVACEQRMTWGVTPSQSLYTGYIQPADNGAFITPIDVPFVVPIESPVNVWVQPIRAPENLAGAPIEETVIVSFWKGVGCPYSFGGTFWLPIPVAATVNIPDWTGACSCLIGAAPTPVMNWIDATGANVGTWTGVYSPRPRRAAAVSHNEQDTVNILCHWTQ